MFYERDVHKLCIEIQSECLEIVLPDDFRDVVAARVESDKLVVSSYRGGILEIDLNGEIYGEKYVEAEVDSVHIYDVVCLIQEALQEDKLEQVFQRW